MSQQYPPDNGNQQWNNPQQPYQQYPQQPQQQPYYPQQPPMYQQPPKKRLLWPWFVGGGCLVLILAICGILFALGKFATTATQSTLTNIEATAQSASQSDTTPTSVSAHHKLNETVSVDNTWQVTVTKVSTYQGNTISTPTTGNTFIQIEVSMKNISKQQQIVSSLIQYSLHDTSGQKYTENLLTGTAGPDGTVAAGDPLKGTITYEVPANTKSFVLDFTPNFSGQQISWDLSL
jgi:hypothetical protein